MGPCSWPGPASSRLPKRIDAQALAVLRGAIAAGVDHIDTSDFYGPHVVNQLIREALHPYPKDLVIVTKLGARREADASWNPAHSPADLIAGAHDNLRNLGLDALDVVNLRLMGPDEALVDEGVTTLAELQQKGLIRHIGLSNATSRQLAKARSIAEIVCVQNMYNVAQRGDDPLIDELAALGIAYVPFFPLGGFRAAAIRRLRIERRRFAGARPGCRRRWPGCCTGRRTCC